MPRKFLSIMIVLNSYLFSLSAMADIVPYKGIENVSLPKELSLSVVTKKDFDFVDDEGVRRYWKTTILLKKKNKLLWEKVYKEVDNIQWVYGNIVPIRKNKYYADLNEDGFPEVAILPWDLGMAVYRTAEIYTVYDDGLVKYGEGKFNFEFGPNVLLGCPKCWKFDMDACTKCF